MNFKHFLKTLLIFLGMIALGLIGVYLINHFDSSENQIKKSGDINIAK